jgi:hypothetical protein
MKSCTVVIPGPIEPKILEQARYIAVEDQSPLNAARWPDRVLSAVESLSSLPPRTDIAYYTG